MEFSSIKKMIMYTLDGGYINLNMLYRELEKDCELTYPEIYWENKCITDLEVVNKIPYKSWKLTYKVHMYIHTIFPTLIKEIFSSFTKYKGDSYEDNPETEKIWRFYRKITENRLLTKICNWASLQSKFLNQYTELVLKEFNNVYPSYIKEDYIGCYDEDYKAVEELVSSLAPIFKRGEVIKVASDFFKFISFPEELTASDLIDEWAADNEDLVERDLIKIRVLYQLFKDDIIMDIPGPIPSYPDDNTIKGNFKGTAQQQLWAFIINEDFPIDM